MGFTELKAKHFQNPQHLVNEFLEDLDLKDKVISQKQDMIRDLRKKVSDLEEKLREKEGQQKSSSIGVQTEEEKDSENPSSRNPSLATDGFHTDKPHTDDVSVSSIKPSTDKVSAETHKLKVKPKQQKSGLGSSSVSKTPSVPKTSKPKQPSVSKKSSLSRPSSLTKTTSTPDVKVTQEARKDQSIKFSDTSSRYKIPSLSKSCSKRKKQKTKTKKEWVQKKASPEPKKMKQVWVVKGTHSNLEVKPTQEERKVHRNHKHKEKKQKAQKLVHGGRSSTAQRHHQVSTSKPNAFLVPNNLLLKSEDVRKKWKLSKFWLAVSLFRIY